MAEVAASERDWHYQIEPSRLYDAWDIINTMGLRGFAMAAPPDGVCLHDPDGVYVIACKGEWAGHVQFLFKARFFSMNYAKLLMPGWEPVRCEVLPIDPCAPVELRSVQVVSVLFRDAGHASRQ